MPHKPENLFDLRNPQEKENQIPSDLCICIKACAHTHSTPTNTPHTLTQTHYTSHKHTPHTLLHTCTYMHTHTHIKQSQTYHMHTHHTNYHIHVHTCIYTHTHTLQSQTHHMHTHIYTLTYTHHISHMHTTHIHIY